MRDIWSPTTRVIVTVCVIGCFIGWLTKEAKSRVQFSQPTKIRRHTLEDKDHVWLNWFKIRERLAPGCFELRDGVTTHGQSGTNRPPAWGGVVGHGSRVPFSNPAKVESWVMDLKITFPCFFFSPFLLSPSNP